MAEYAIDLVRSGSCSPLCMLAESEPQKCTCACGGAYHGTLLDAEVIAHPPRPRIVWIGGKAPTFTCSSCRKKIGATREHMYLKTLDQVWCLSCVSPSKPRGSQGVHARVYPRCPTSWHDMWDHMDEQVCGTRAGIAHVLGRWGAVAVGG